jgi:stage III sporulation protein SpoIIIAA
MMQICKVASLEVTSTPRGDDEYAQQESAEALAQHSVPAPSASPAPPVIVTDDLDALLEVLPADLGGALVEHPLRSQLVEVVLDLGRRPEARFQVAEPEYLREHTVRRIGLTPTCVCSAALVAVRSSVASTLLEPCLSTAGLNPVQVTREELDAAAAAVAPFGTDNRAGIAGTLHRISALRSRSGSVVGLTCRVGRAVSGHVGMARDLLEGECSF